MNSDEVIQAIATAMGVPELRLDAHGCASLRIDDALDVHFEASASSHLLHVYCILGPVPTSHRERCFEQLLSANLFSADTGGAALAIDPEFDEIVVCTDIGNHGWTSELIMSRLARFIDAAAAWRKRFGQAPFDTDGALLRPSVSPIVGTSPYPLA